MLMTKVERSKSGLCLDFYSCQHDSHRLQIAIARNAGKGRIKSGVCSIKSVRLQAFAGTALYLYLPENILQMPAFSCPFTAFLCKDCLCLLRLVIAVQFCQQAMFLRSQTMTFTYIKKIMHPYEWGILDVKAVNFYPLFGCADCSHCSCCCGGFCGSTGINCHNFPIALGQQLLALFALLLTSPRSLVNQPSLSDV